MVDSFSKKFKLSGVGRRIFVHLAHTKFVRVTFTLAAHTRHS